MSVATKCESGSKRQTLSAFSGRKFAMLKLVGIVMLVALIIIAHDRLTEWREK
jgi:hypothetical protein